MKLWMKLFGKKTASKAIILQCPFCKVRLSIEPFMAGRVASCPNVDCKREFSIPAHYFPHQIEQSKPKNLDIRTDKAVARDQPRVTSQKLAKGFKVNSHEEAVAVLTKFVREANLVPVSWEIIRELFKDVTDPRHFENAYKDEWAAEKCAHKLFATFSQPNGLSLFLSSLVEGEHGNKPYARCAVRITARSEVGQDYISFIALAEDTPSHRYLVFDFIEEAEGSLLNEAEAAARAAFRSIPDRGEEIYIYYVRWRAKSGGAVQNWSTHGPRPMASAAAEAFAGVLKKYGIESTQDYRID